MRRGRQITTLRNTRPDSGAFDLPVFECKFEEILERKRRKIEEGRLRVRDANIALSFNINEAYLMKLVDTDIGVLRDFFVPAVEKACCDVWRSGGNAITSVFICEEWVPRVRAAVKDFKAEIRKNLETLFITVVRPSNWCLPSVLDHLSREMNDFEKDMKDRQDSKIDQLEKQELQAVAVVSQAPPSLGSSGPKPKKLSKRGPKLNTDRHRDIAEVVKSFGDDWKQLPNLEKIAKELVELKVPPIAKWAKRDRCARSWTRAVEYYPDLVRKALVYSLKMAAKDSFEKPSQTLANSR